MLSSLTYRSTSMIQFSTLVEFPLNLGGFGNLMLDRLMLLLMTDLPGWLGRSSGFPSGLGSSSGLGSLSGSGSPPGLGSPSGSGLPSGSWSGSGPSSGFGLLSSWWFE